MLPQPVGGHDTESSRTADCVGMVVSDELMNLTVHLLPFWFAACHAVVVLSIFAFASCDYVDKYYYHEWYTILLLLIILSQHDRSHRLSVVRCPKIGWTARYRVKSDGWLRWENCKWWVDEFDSAFVAILFWRMRCCCCFEYFCICFTFWWWRQILL